MLYLESRIHEGLNYARIAAWIVNAEDHVPNRRSGTDLLDKPRAPTALVVRTGRPPEEKIIAPIVGRIRRRPDDQIIALVGYAAAKTAKNQVSAIAE